MTNEQAKAILLKLISDLSLKRSEYLLLEQAINVLCSSGVKDSVK